MSASRLEFACAGSGLVFPETGRIGVYRARPGADYARIGGAELILGNSFRPDFDQLAARGYDVQPQIAGPFRATLVHITRSKPETLGLVARAMLATEPHGIVAVDGARTDGIDSILKAVKSLLPPLGVVAKAHGKLFWFARPESLPVSVPRWSAWLEPAKNPAGFLTAPGMFSPGKIDKGSALLAAHIDDRLKGDIADLGAGWGWLAQAVLTRGAPTRLDLHEAEQTALDAARANINDPRAYFHWADVLRLGTDRTYDAVITNPPFHRGRAAEASLGAEFIKSAANILKPNGHLWLVANRQLPYENVLDTCFHRFETLEQTPYFKVFRAAKPRIASARNPARIRIGSR